jgi:mersacidin/lichenicidin family type 2 lantibiotic
MTTTIDLVRAWKDEDYRESVGLELADHPAGTIDLSSLEVPELSETTTITISIAICESIAKNCFTSWPYICTTVNCFTELADSRN